MVIPGRRKLGGNQVVNALVDPLNLPVVFPPSFDKLTFPLLSLHPFGFLTVACKLTKPDDQLREFAPADIAGNDPSSDPFFLVVVRSIAPPFDAHFETPMRAGNPHERVTP